jgi:hypothetical protein
MENWQKNSSVRYAPVPEILPGASCLEQYPVSNGTTFPGTLPCLFLVRFSIRRMSWTCWTGTALMVAFFFPGHQRFHFDVRRQAHVNKDADMKVYTLKPR